MKLLWSVFTIGLCVYLVAAVALYALQRKFIYFPTAAIEHPFDELVIENSATTTKLPAARIRLITLNPGLPNAVIYFGGNAESTAHTAAEFARHFTEQTVYLVNYRGYGGSTGAPSEAALHADALAIYDGIGDRHRQIAAIGRSLGSGVACRLATSRSLTHLVLVTPYDSILRIAKNQYPMFPVGLLLRDRFESSRYASSIESPVLAVLASHDAVIPADSSQRLIEAFTSPVKKLILHNTGHNDLQAHALYYPSIQEFLLTDL